MCAENADTPPRTTALGTPCSRRWDAPWIVAVDAAELKLERRICGARCTDGTPCTLASNHPNGRCRFHGGFDLTGAQPGNRNAVLHGLYSRQLQVCGQHCPRWKHCPLAGDDVHKLPGPKKPICAYEQAGYNASVTDFRHRLNRGPVNDPFYKHLIHHLALLQVLMTRAASAMAVSPMTSVNTASSDSYFMSSTNVNAVSEAYLRFAREFRRYLELLPDFIAVLDEDEAVAQQRRIDNDTNLTPEAQFRLHEPDEPKRQAADRYFNKACNNTERYHANALASILATIHRLHPEKARAYTEMLLQRYSTRKPDREKVARIAFDLLCENPP